MRWLGLMHAAVQLSSQPWVGWKEVPGNLPLENSLNWRSRTIVKFGSGGNARVQIVWILERLFICFLALFFGFVACRNFEAESALVSLLSRFGRLNIPLAISGV